MLEELKKQFTSVHILITLLIVAVGIFILQTIWQVLGNFSDVFIILISAWLLSFILEPAVEYATKIVKSKIAAGISVYIIFLALLGVTVFMFIPQVTIQLQSLFTILPKFLAQYPGVMQKWGDFLNSSLNSSIVLIPSVANFFISTFFALIISFYFVIDKERINQEFFNILPKNWHKEVQYVQDIVNTTFASFLRVQLVFALLSGLATWLVLRALGVDFAASSSLLAGILTLIPLIGSGLALIPPILVAFIMDPARALIAAIALLILQQVIFNIIGPRIMGKAFKMHPVIILLSFIVGYKVAGVAGAIFGIPVLSILLVVIHRLSKHFINKEK